MKWINVIGLCLQFAAFWFAAPELLGDRTLKRFEQGLIGFVSKFPVIFVGLVSLVTGFGMGIYGIIEGMKMSNQEGSYYYYMITLAVVMVLYFLFIAFHQRISNWMRDRVAEPLVQGLIEDDNSRKNALVVGALLFSLGFFLQLTASIFG